VGRLPSKDSAKLLDEVADGDRSVEHIKSPQLRETVRLALRLHKDPYSGPDGTTRSRIRFRVLNGLRPRRANVIDRVAIAFELLSKPTPYAMRGLALGLLVITLGAGTAAASAGTVANDVLYSVKIKSEQVRLALATSPEDRAVVQLSIAEHRLAEAIDLATLGNEDDAIVATSEYGEHMANAAAELAQVESLQPATATLVIQLRQRIDAHRTTAAAVVAQFAGDPSRVSAAAALAAVGARSSRVSGLSPAAAIAQDAADAADEAASVAERMSIPPGVIDEPRSSWDAAKTRASVDRTKAAPDTAQARNETRHDERRPKERASAAARRAADEARAAAEKAKHGNRETLAPHESHDSNSDEEPRTDD
jgi:hypothetical protein